jgi:hypothetical protein
VRDQLDLYRLFEALDIVYFDGELRNRGIKIVWRKFRKGKKSFVYARHYLEDKLIVVNQHLARADVPTYVPNPNPPNYSQTKPHSRKQPVSF